MYLTTNTYTYRKNKIPKATQTQMFLDNNIWADI